MNILSVDLGGTRIKLALWNQNAIIREDTIPAQSHHPVAETMSRVVRTVKDKFANPQLDAIALGFPGLVDVKHVRVTHTYGKYDDAPAFDWIQWSKDSFGARMYMDNDARLAALGEWQDGAGEGCHNMLMITLGTGIGTTAIVDGKMLRGHRGRAGILGGHIVLNRNGTLCDCGQRGCLEAEASTASLKRWHKKQPHQQRLDLPEELDYRWVFTEASRGQPVATEMLEHTLEIWSLGVQNLVQAYDPQRIVIGGGIAASFDTIAEFLYQKLETWGSSKVELLPASLADRAAHHGAKIFCEMP